jgi:hypothetical protein
MPAAPPPLDSKTAAKVAPLLKLPTSNVPLDSPLLQAQHGRAPLKSPGIASLREAFDITYAVHRMEEEGARRRAHGAGAGGPRAHLPGLNEIDEEGGASEVARRAIDTRSRQTGRRTGASGSLEAKRAAAAAAADSSLVEGRAGQRDLGRHQPRAGAGRHAPPPSGLDEDSGNWFDLDIGGATLLNRRQRDDKKPELAMTPAKPTSSVTG